MFSRSNILFAAFLGPSFVTMHHTAKKEPPSDDEDGILVWDEYMVEGDDMIDEPLEMKEESVEGDDMIDEPLEMKDESKEEACTFC